MYECGCGGEDVFNHLYFSLCTQGLLSEYLQKFYLLSQEHTHTQSNENKSLPRHTLYFRLCVRQSKGTHEGPRSQPRFADHTTKFWSWFPNQPYAHDHCLLYVPLTSTPHKPPRPPWGWPAFSSQHRLGASLYLLRTSLTEEPPGILSWTDRSSGDTDWPNTVIQKIPSHLPQLLIIQRYISVMVCV